MEFSEGRAAVCIGACDLDHQIGYRTQSDHSVEELEPTFKYGFIDENGKVVINPAFETVQQFYEGLAAVCIGKGCYGGKYAKEEKKWGYVDKSGAMVIPPQFSDVEPFQSGLAAVCVGDGDDRRCGFADKSGKYVVDPRYLAAFPFEQGVALVVSENADGEDEMGYIDEKGHRFWPPDSSGGLISPKGNFRDTNPLLIIVGTKAHKKTGYINRKGRIIISPQWDTAYKFSEGLALVCVGECDGDHLMGEHFSDDYSSRTDVEQNFKYGFINEQGGFAVNPAFEDANNFSEGLAPVCVGSGCYSRSKEKQNRRWGYVDSTGTMAIAPQFDYANDFKEGLAPVSVGGKWGYIDKTGKFAINPQYDSTLPFEGGIAKVGSKMNVDEEYGYIDKTGKVIWAPSH